MTSEQWIRDTYLVVNAAGINKECIYWGSNGIYYGIFTPIDFFLEEFGETIQVAIDHGKDTEGIKQAIRGKEKDNRLGFNDYI